MSGTADRLTLTAASLNPPYEPDPDWIRGQCPLCGNHLVTNAYHVGGRGYVLLTECWAGLGDPAHRTCDYRMEL